jgi:hemerythrin-like domain-containing protein
MEAAEMIENTDRRIFLNKVGVIAAATCLKSLIQPAFAAGAKEEDVSPVEDLMREHGLLNRVLLIYDHCSNKLQNKEDLDLNRLAEARDIIQNFVEAYHEKLEEQHLFPRFEKAQKLTDLVAVLRSQHLVGRHVTAEIGTALTKKDHTALILSLRAFTHMYRPHEAREDTVLFPAFQSLVSTREYNELGEQFEEREHQLFGKDGFEGQVARVEKIERQLGIYDLSQFTPKV